MLVRSVRRYAVIVLALSITRDLAWAEPPTEMSRNDISILIVSDSKVATPQSLRLASGETEEVSGDTETVRERFKNGRVRVEKTVVLNDQGNFVPHGAYTEWNEKGEMVQTGTYKNGLREGVWIRIASSTEAQLLQTTPYNKFKGPFQSTVEFSDGEMNGVWSITDADNRVVSHVSLEKGLRDGRAIWNLPSGVSIYEADYVRGVLNGLFVEKDAAGKITKQLDYIEGSVRQIDRETFPNKSPKSEIQVLSGKAKLIARDNFDSFTLATYEAAGEPVPDGDFVYYHANGTVRSRGVYSLGELTGKFESWHPNGERESIGNYEKGVQFGKWTWWHANGMRKSSGQYEHGQLLGDLLAWDEQGRLTPAALEKKVRLVATSIEQPDDVQVAEDTRSPSTRRR